MVNDLNESPAFASSASFSAAENQTSIGSVSVSDPESGSITYALSGTDASSMAISSSGVLAFASAPNYEVDNSYSATVTASDGTNSVAQNITVSVTDANDTPIATAASYYMNLKPQAQTTGYVTLAGTDEDGDSLTYSIVSNGSYGSASVSGTSLTYVTSSGTQSASSESFTFKVNDGTVDSSNATITISLRTDPLYQYQWHLNNTGQTNFATDAGTSGVDLNLDTIISSGIDGSGITVAVVDSELQIAHEDLSPNMVPNKSYDYANSDNDPTSSDSSKYHGTAVAGIIGADAWNNLGGRGVAPDASLVGYNYMSNQGVSNFVDALGGAADGGADTSDVDIFNMSFGTALNASFPGIFSLTKEAALLNGVTNLRSGKGAIYVNAAGNDWHESKSGSTYFCGPNYGTSNTVRDEQFPCWDANLDSNFATPVIIGVASLSAADVRAHYSTPGSSVWVSGFGGQTGGNTDHIGGVYVGGNKPAIMTTDVSSCSKGGVQAGISAGSGQNGNAFNNGDHSENSSCNYNSGFTGTSAAAPTVSGVIALILEANPNLTWRDVKHILASTSTQVDASKSKSYLGVKQYDWITNTAGYKHHNWYGFGKINAAAAVSAAESYTAGSLGSFVSASSTSGTINSTFSSYARTSYNLSISAPAGSAGKVEFARVLISMSHIVPNNVGLELKSPDGTTVPILQSFTRVTNNPNGTVFAIGVAGLYGENMAGTWTLYVTDYTNDSVNGTLGDWGIIVYGH